MDYTLNSTRYRISHLSHLQPDRRPRCWQTRCCPPCATQGWWWRSWCERQSWTWVAIFSLAMLKLSKSNLTMKKCSWFKFWTPNQCLPSCLWCLKVATGSEMPPKFLRSHTLMTPSSPPETMKGSVGFQSGRVGGDKWANGQCCGSEFWIYYWDLATPAHTSTGTLQTKRMKFSLWLYKFQGNFYETLTNTRRT